MIRRRLLPAIVLCAALLLHADDTFEQRIWRGQYASEQAAPVQIVSWNIERGLRLEEIKTWLKGQPPSLLLLQEVDVHARRSGGVHVADELAKTLATNFVLAAEFEELAQGSSSRPAYQGQAILTSLPFHEVRILRYREQSEFWRPRWFLPNKGPFQRRQGGRLALAAEMKVNGGELAVYNTHLESRGPESMRVNQIKEVIEDAKRYPATATVVIAGDLNVEGNGSPVLRAMEEAGFTKVAGGEITTKRGKPLDWIYARGPMRFTEAKVHADMQAADHFPVTAKVK